MDDVELAKAFYKKYDELLAMCGLMPVSPAFDFFYQLLNVDVANGIISELFKITSENISKSCSAMVEELQGLTSDPDKLKELVKKYYKGASNE